MPLHGPDPKTRQAALYVRHRADLRACAWPFVSEAACGRTSAAPLAAPFAFLSPFSGSAASLSTPAAAILAVCVLAFIFRYEYLAQRSEHLGHLPGCGSRQTHAPGSQCSQASHAYAQAAHQTMPARLSATPASFLGGMASLKMRKPPARMMTVFRWPTCAHACPAWGLMAAALLVPCPKPSDPALAWSPGGLASPHAHDVALQPLDR